VVEDQVSGLALHFDNDGVLRAVFTPLKFGGPSLRIVQDDSFFGALRACAQRFPRTNSCDCDALFVLRITGFFGALRARAPKRWSTAALQKLRGFGFDKDRGLRREFFFGSGFQPLRFFPGVILGRCSRMGWQWAFGPSCGLDASGVWGFPSRSELAIHQGAVIGQSAGAGDGGGLF